MHNDEVTITFLGQPFLEAEQIGTIIGRALREADRDTAWFATAWGKRSGLSRLAKEIESFRERGGRAEAIVGVDEGGATEEGLRLALDVFDQAYVFHDPGARTFHPKIYVVEGNTAATVLVGSGNLTRGGLYTNYEAAIAAELDLNDQGDADFRASVRAYYERLLDLGAVCKPLTATLIEDLIADPNVIVQSEQQANRQRARRRRTETSNGAGLFGAAAVPGLRNAPPADITPVQQEEEDEDTVLVPQQEVLQPDDTALDSDPSGAGPPVLVAEIPRNAPKRTQLDVGVEYFQSFFGGTVGQHEQVRLQHVGGGGQLGSIEARTLFGTKSHNYRLEAAAGRGRDYPASGRPLGVFVRMPDGLVKYQLLWPGDSGHVEVAKLLTAKAGPQARSMRRVMTTAAELMAAWPAGARLT